MDLKEYELVCEHATKFSKWMESNSKMKLCEVEDMKLVGCLSKASYMLEKFDDTISFTKQLIKLYVKSEGYQQLEAMNYMKRLIVSQIQCKHFEAAMKTFKKLKFYSLNSMNPND